MLTAEPSSSHRVLAGSVLALLAVVVAGHRVESITPSVPPPPTTIVEPTAIVEPPPDEPQHVYEPAPRTYELPVYAYSAAVDRDYIYWTEASGTEDAIAHLWRAHVDDLRAERISHSAGYAFALTDTHVIYGDVTGTAIRMSALDSADSEADDRVLAELSTEPLEIVIGGGYVYWTGWKRTIHRVSLDGGAITNLGLGASPDPIAADDQYLYVANNSTGKLVRVSHTTRKVETLARGFKGASNVVVVGNSVFVTAHRSLYRIADGTTTVLGTAGEAHRLVANGDNLYWTTWADTTIASTDDCDGFQRGVVRVVDAHSGGMEIVEADCGVRGVAAGPGGVFQLEHTKIVRGD